MSLLRSSSRSLYNAWVLEALSRYLSSTINWDGFLCFLLCLLHCEDWDESLTHIHPFHLRGTCEDASLCSPSSAATLWYKPMLCLQVQLFGASSCPLPPSLNLSTCCLQPRLSISQTKAPFKPKWMARLRSPHTFLKKKTLGHSQDSGLTTLVYI